MNHDKNSVGHTHSTDDSVNLGHSSAYHFGSRWVAITLAIILALLILMERGPFYSSSNGTDHLCCSGDNAGLAAAKTALTANTASLALTPTAAGFASLAFDSTTGKVTLSGEVGRELDKQTLLADAAKAYGANTVIDALTVKTGLTSLGAVTLTGNVPSETKKRTEGNLAKTLFAPATINNHLIVATPATVVAAVSPVITETVKAVSTSAACGNTLKANVGFATGSAQLSIAGQAALDAMVSCLPQGGAITGHTDNVGQADNNQRLSERRAQAVRTYLIRKGVKHLSAQGMGDTTPVADNATAQGRTQNRRMEIVPQS
jgi:OmpA-OmpF porin, OOP family